MPKVAIVAALEREVHPAVKNWSCRVREHQGRTFKFFEKERWVLVCGGIGAEAARRATEAVITLYRPDEVVSLGFAGALESMQVGELFVPGSVLNVKDGSRVRINDDGGMLATYPGVVDAAQKAKLASAYGARAVDMEAAAVAHGAQARGLSFKAVKAISDTSTENLPATDAFIGPDGQFLTAKFAVHVMLRPWLWARVMRLAKNSGKAARTLSQWLNEQSSAPGVKQISELQEVAHS